MCMVFLLSCGNLFKKLITGFWKEQLPQYEMNLSFICHGGIFTWTKYSFEIVKPSKPKQKPINQQTKKAKTKKDT